MGFLASVHGSVDEPGNGILIWQSSDITFQLVTNHSALSFSYRQIRNKKPSSSTSNTMSSSGTSNQTAARRLMTEYKQLTAGGKHHLVGLSLCGFNWSHIHLHVILHTGSPDGMFTAGKVPKECPTFFAPANQVLGSLLHPMEHVFHLSTYIISTQMKSPRC